MTDTLEPTGSAGDPHPALDTLADYAEGLLSAGGGTAVAAHVDRCPHCRDHLAGLGAVTSTLAAAPDPGPLPADVAARIEDALAAARSDLLVAAIPGGHAAKTRRWSGRPAARRLPRALPRLLVAASATAVVALGGWVALSGRQPADMVAGGGGDGGTESAATSAEESARESATDLGPTAAAGAPQQEVRPGGDDSTAEAPSPARALEDDLARLLREAAELRGNGDRPGQRGCGSTLAAELRREVVTVADTTVRGRTAVLVLVTGDPTGAGYQAWALPGCDSGAGEALAVLPVPAG